MMPKDQQKELLETSLGVEEDCDQHLDSEDQEGDVVSDIEFILPWEVIETCSRLKPGGASCFWSVNKEAQTTSQLSLHKMADQSIKIRVTVMALGKSLIDTNNVGAEATNGQQSGTHNDVEQDFDTSAHTNGQIPSDDTPFGEEAVGPQLHQRAFWCTQARSGALDEQDTDIMNESGKNEEQDQDGELPSVQSGKTYRRSKAGDSVVIDVFNDSRNAEEIDREKDVESEVTFEESFNGAPASSTTVIIVKTVAHESSYSNDVMPAAEEHRYGLVGAPLRVHERQDDGEGVVVKKASRDIAERMKAKKLNSLNAAQNATTCDRNMSYQRSLNHVAVNKGVAPQRYVQKGATAGPQGLSSPNKSSPSTQRFTSPVTGKSVARQPSGTAAQRNSAEHRKQQSSGGAALSCELCAEGASGYPSLIRHVQLQHEDCLFVRTYIEELQPLMEAAQKKKAEKKVAVEDVSKLSAQRMRLETTSSAAAAASRDRQIASSHEDSDMDVNDDNLMTCGVCKKTFVDNLKMRRHMTQAHSDRVHGCTHCDKLFSAKDSLIRHLKKHETQGGRAHPGVQAGRGSSQPDQQHRPGVAARGKVAKRTKNVGSFQQKGSALKKTTVFSPPTFKSVGGRPAMVDAQKSVTSAGLAAKSSFTKVNSKAAGSGVGASKALPGIVCDRCDSVFSTATTLATHMRYCRTERAP